MNKEDVAVDIEETIGKLYLCFYKLRQNGFYQEEYEMMGTLMNMLSQDRQYMREKFPQLIP